MSIDFYRRLVAEARADGIRKYTVRAAIPRGGKLLVLNRPQDYSGIGSLDEFVGGKVRPGEHLGAALNREVVQEIGWYARDVRRYLGHRDFRTGEGIKVREFYFEVRTSIPSNFRLESIPIRLSEDHVSYAWVRKRELEATRMSRAVIGMLRQYYN